MEALFSTNNGRVTFQGKPISEETAKGLRVALRREAANALPLGGVTWTGFWSAYHQLNDALDAIWRKEEVA